MNEVISFKTSQFDTSKETPNPINPIAGESVLVWLEQNFSLAGYELTDPSPEDWGWYISATGPSGTYMIGAVAFDEEDGASGLEIEWLIQFDRKRTLKEILLGKGKATRDDQLVSAVFATLASNEAFHDVAWE